MDNESRNKLCLMKLQGFQKNGAELKHLCAFDLITQLCVFWLITPGKCLRCLLMSLTQCFLKVCMCLFCEHASV